MLIGVDPIPNQKHLALLYSIIQLGSSPLQMIACIALAIGRGFQASAAKSSKADIRNPEKFIDIL